MRKMFSREYIEKELRRISNKLDKEINAYLIGGCGMSFRGLKRVTKDMDIVFFRPEELKAFSSLLKMTYFSGRFAAPLR